MLDEVANNTTLLIKEAIHIHLTDTEKLLNRDKAVAIYGAPPIGSRILRQTPLTSNDVTTDAEAKLTQAKADSSPAEAEATLLTLN